MILLPRSNCSRGSFPNTFDQDGYTPLMLTALRGRTILVKLLLAHGAQPDLHKAPDATPLTMACEEGHLEIVRLLIGKGANPNIRNEIGQTPLMLRRQSIRRRSVVCCWQRASMSMPQTSVA